MELIVDSRAGGIAVVRLKGRLDRLTTMALSHALHEVIAGGAHRLIVDLADVVFIDSSALGVMVGGLGAARTAGGDLRIARLPEQARRLLALTSLDRVVRLYTTVDEALTDYRGTTQHAGQHSLVIERSISR